MFGWFKKKEPVPYWGSFQYRMLCNECENLECFVDDAFNGVCPKCGSKDIKKVVARWQFANELRGMASMERVKLKYEIRKE
jgi:anaerobic ribonucleoside-triphosphate reductase